jgi:hypothetical protein
VNLWRMWFWPNVAIRRQAQYAINEAFCAAALVTVVTAVLAAMAIYGDSVPDIDPSALAEATIFAGITFGIYRRSRTAAVAGLALYVLERGYLIYISGGPRNVLWSFVIAMAFVNGVRGTFAYHRLPPAPTGLPPIEQSFQDMAKRSGTAKQSTQTQHDDQKKTPEQLT